MKKLYPSEAYFNNHHYHFCFQLYIYGVVIKVGKNETMGDITFVITVVLNNFKTCFQRVENKKIVSYQLISISLNTK